MAPLSHIASSWKAYFSQPSNGSSHLRSIRDAVQHTFNDSAVHSRQSLREVTLLLLLEHDREEAHALRDEIQRKGFFLEDPRSQAYLALHDRLLRHQGETHHFPNIQVDDSLEAVELLLLQLAYASVANDRKVSESAYTALHVLSTRFLQNPYAFAIDAAEFELLTPAAIFSPFFACSTDEYAGRLENIQLFHHLRAYCHTIDLPKDTTQAQQRETSILGPPNTAAGSLFSYMKDTLGIVACCPSFFPLGEVGPQSLTLAEDNPQCASFQKTAASGKVDIGWSHWEASPSGAGIDITIHFVVHEEMFPFAVACYVKCDELQLEEGRVLRPKSLDRYRASCCAATGITGTKKLSIQSDSLGEMHAIPLAGNGYFFNADYLIAYVLDGEQDSIRIHCE